MSAAEWFRAVPWALTLAFSAGAFLAGFRIGLRQLRRDLNGAMARNREEHRTIADELHNMALGLMVVSERRDDREILFWALKR